MRFSGKRWLFLAGCLLLIGCIASPIQNVQAKESKIKYGWIKKGGHSYYRKKNGKYYKDTFAKIGKHYYVFDKKGRVRTEDLPTDYSATAHFGKKSGRFLYETLEVEVVKRVPRTKKRDGYVLVENENGDCFFISRYAAEENLVDRKNQKCPFYKLRQGKRLRVYFTRGIGETGPLQFLNMIKVKLL